MRKLPTLYHAAKKGEIRVWKIWTENDTIFTEYGVLDGKLQVSEKKATPKNVGRSNETTAAQQAELEAASLWTYKKERKYRESIEEAQQQLLLPMLAKGFDKNKNKIKYPCYLQPKLDGVRCLAHKHNGVIYLYSRQGKEYELPHIQEELQHVPDGTILDGEIYIHGMSLQQIVRLVKKWRPNESPTLKYYIYDYPDHKPNNWKHRYAALNDLQFGLPDTLSSLVFVHSDVAFCEEDVWNLHSSYIGDGYEGAIVRTPDHIYRWGYRSDGLLKVKQHQDSEFEIIGAKEGRGRMAGKVVWVCKNDLNDEQFDCSMKCTMEEREQYWQNHEQYYGKLLTAKFFDRTDKNVPKYAVGLAIRDYE